MPKIIVLKHDTECHKCGAMLEAGTRAKWYGRGIVFGFHCHSSRLKQEEPETPAGFYLAVADAVARKNKDIRRYFS